MKFFAENLMQSSGEILSFRDGTHRKVSGETLGGILGEIPTVIPSSTNSRTIGWDISRKGEMFEDIISMILS